jgi:hypothetical protein
MDLFNIVASSMKLVGVIACGLNQARSGPTGLFWVNRRFARFRPCTSQLLQSVFTAKYFCVLPDTKYRVQAVERFYFCTLDARKSRHRNRQHTEKMELRRRATRSPCNDLVVALFVYGLHDVRITCLQKFFTSRNFFRAVPPRTPKNLQPQMERLGSGTRYARALNHPQNLKKFRVGSSSVRRVQHR